LEKQLAPWQEILPSILQWKDGKDPPGDINAARLCAKYYEAHYLTFQPFLDYALYLSRPEQLAKAPVGKPAAEFEGAMAPATALSSLPSVFSTSSNTNDVVAPLVRPEQDHIDNELFY
jgi:hypothetical protein